MKRSGRLVMVLVVLAGVTALIPIDPARAAGVVGDGTPESCTEDALDTALGAGGSVTFNCGPNPVTITVTSEKVIAADTQIDGGGLVTLSGGNQTRILSVNVGVSLTLSNLTLSEGSVSTYPAGAAVLNFGSLTIINSTFSDNTASFGGGGAIHNREGTLDIVNSTFSNNDGGAGAIDNYGGTLDITASTFNSNDGGSGGAISSISNAFGSGGTLTVTDCIFSNNGPGGAISLFDVTMTVTESAFLGNGEGGSGGGGAIDNYLSETTITRSTFRDNSAGTQGGAIESYGTLVISDSTFRDNTSGFFAGAIYASGTLTITNSTLSGNTAQLGGAIVNNGQFVLTNSTVHGNSALFEGGALYSWAPSQPVSTGNPDADGRNLQQEGGLVSIVASIIAGNSAPSGPNCYIPSDGTPITSLGSNLSDDASCFFTQPTDIQNSTAVGLGPLADNGGPTQTMLPQPGSDAIDNAACLTDQDQRGQPRPSGSACDIGAVEVQQATFPLCVSPTTGMVTSPRQGSGCQSRQIQLDPFGQTFCVDPYTGRLLYSFGRQCTPPRRAHVLPDDGDLLTCVNQYTRLNRWVRSHSQCTTTEVPNTIPAMP